TSISDLPSSRRRVSGSRSRNGLGHGAADKKLVNALEVLGPVEGDLDLPLHPALPADPDGGPEDSLQFFFQSPLGGLTRTFRARPRGLLRPGALHLGLDLAHAPAIVDRPPRELDHLMVVAHPEEGPGVPGRKPTLGHELTHRCREVEESERVRDRRAILADRLRDLL